MITVQTEVMIEAPIKFCFDLARDLPLHTETVWPHTKETIVKGPQDRLLEKGDTVTFEATHLGIRQRLTARIVAFERPSLFVDEMIEGAFKSLRHEHRFESLNGKTLMRDILTFEAPFGFAGRIAEQIILRKYMTLFLKDRGHRFKEEAEQRYATRV